MEKLPKVGANVSKITQYEYDELNRLIKVTNQTNGTNGTNETIYTYDDRDNLIS